MSWTFFNSNGEALVQHAESEATQAEMEAETAVAKFVPPDLVKNSPGVAKARWHGNANQVTMTQDDSYNMTGFTDNAAGDHTFTIATDFADATYSVVAMGGHINNTVLGITVQQYDTNLVARAAGSFRAWVSYNDGSSNILVDCNELDLVFFGDQV
jgi:hypothetical protein